MNKPLQSLDEFNEDRRKSLQELDMSGLPNGIACPKCGAELFDSNPNVILTSYPAQKNVVCIGCGYSGYRLA